jgi:hypothetical protein
MASLTACQLPPALMIATTLHGRTLPLHAAASSCVPQVIGTAQDREHIGLVTLRD